jgi:hypothetical protein
MAYAQTTELHDLRAYPFIVDTGGSTGVRSIGDVPDDLGANYLFRVFAVWFEVNDATWTTAPIMVVGSAIGTPNDIVGSAVTLNTDPTRYLTRVPAGPAGAAVPMLTGGQTVYANVTTAGVTSVGTPDARVWLVGKWYPKLAM